MAKFLPGGGRGSTQPRPHPFNAPQALKSIRDGEEIGPVLFVIETNKLTVGATRNPLCCTGVRNRKCSRAALVSENLR